MSDRDEILAYLGLPASTTFSEIEHAYNVRCNSASERLAAGDESARVELAALKEVFGRLTGRSAEQLERRASAYGRVGSAAEPAEVHLRAPAWWECYLSLIAALASAVALAALIADFPHIYHKGSFLYPLLLIALAALFSTVGTMLSEAEFRQGERAHLLRSRGLESGDGPPRLRFHVARIAIYISRGVRWLIGPAILVILFLNFASLKGRYSLRY
jgi:hypothetical protein